MNKNLKRSLIILIILLISVVHIVSADNASKLIGTIVYYVEEIQKYPNWIDNALCDGDREEYRAKLSDMVDLIMSANDAMSDARLPNTLNLWQVYNAVIANPHCGVHDAALSRADWSREELNRIGERFGLFYEAPADVARMCGSVQLGVSLASAMQTTGELSGTTCEMYMSANGFDPADCARPVTTCTYNTNFGYNGNLYYDVR